MWTIFTQHEPAPHPATSGLIPSHLFTDPTPNLWALLDWAQESVVANPGLLNFHVVILWYAEKYNLYNLTPALRPLVTEMAQRTAIANRKALVEAADRQALAEAATGT